MHLNFLYVCKLLYNMLCFNDIMYEKKSYDIIIRMENREGISPIGWNDE
jgi:hypothetical protein